MLDHDLRAFDFDDKMAVTKKDAFARASRKICGLPKGVKNSLSAESLSYGHRMDIYGM
jgi:hypothetical protein